MVIPPQTELWRVLAAVSNAKAIAGVGVIAVMC